MSSRFFGRHTSSMDKASWKLSYLPFYPVLLRLAQKTRSVHVKVWKGKANKVERPTSLLPGKYYFSSEDNTPQAGGAAPLLLSLSAEVSCLGSYPTVGAKPISTRDMRTNTAKKTMSLRLTGWLTPYSAQMREPSLNCALIVEAPSL